jgi:two-component system CheB/CheR fusion protein
VADLAAVAAVGASAGGVEALGALFRATRRGTGIGYVVQMHLPREGSSALTEILARDCPLTVETATDGALLAADRVLVVPAAKLATVEQGRLRLTPDEVPHHPARQIDILFSALAVDLGERAIGVVLSGSGSDGTLGVKAIKEHGGLTVAQGSDGSSPVHHGMPDSAIAAGLVDMVLPAAEIPAALATYAQSFPQLAALTTEKRTAEDKPRIDTARRTICEALRRATGHDFAGYKERSFLRRVQRRMQVLKITAIEAYADCLEHSHDEAMALLRDLLISVTSFFRDAEAFAALAETVIPRLFEGKGAADCVRVWVPGCATGEEAYSIAILLREHAARCAVQPRLQVFATDIDETALQVARLGHYPEPHLDGVGAERLERFFVRAGGGRTVAKEIRDICVFSAHSMVRDPPFSRLDLISCRNLLIYLDTATQRDLFPVFHFALRPGGYLFLGSAESANQFGELFRPIDQHHRVYKRRDQVPSPLPLSLPRQQQGPRGGPRPAPATAPARATRDAAERLVLERHAPAHAVVNRDGDVIHFSGRTSRFLEVAPGQPTRSLLALARRGLRLDLRTALQDAMQSRRPVRRQGLNADQVGLPGPVSIAIEPIPDSDPAEPLFLVVFDEAAPPPAAARPMEGAAEEAIAASERELQDTRERLQALIEEHETAVAELRASNEELVSVNEELQSANEELETSKEEQQSVNEELQTVNIELQTKLEQLSRANADLSNLFDATRVATIMLDDKLAIRGFTPAVTGLFNLRPTDAGRPLADIAGAFDTQALLQDALMVLRGTVPMERRLTSRDGKAHYLQRVLPYLTAEGRMDGVIAAFVDVTQLVEAVEGREHQRVLVDELNHRVRNMLQVVIGLTRLTMRDAASPEVFGEQLIGRMQAMSMAYQLIAKEQWGDVLLQDLVMQQLGPHLSQPQRAIVLGPAIALRPAAAVALGLVLHDLATNAVKYGALGGNAGLVSVRWMIEDKDGHPSLNLVWEEQGGPPVKPPTRFGFGSPLIVGQVERALRGTLAFDFRRSGLCATITAPLDRDLRIVAEDVDAPVPAKA